MTSPIAAMTEDVQSGFANFHPDGAPEMIGFFGDLPEFYDGLASALSALGARMASEMPLHTALAEQMNEMSSHVAGLRDEANEMNASFRQLHEADIARHEEPRPAESAWNVPG